jgi:hypothetical protein
MLKYIYIQITHMQLSIFNQIKIALRVKHIYQLSAIKELELLQSNKNINITYKMLKCSGKM